MSRYARNGYRPYTMFSRIVEYVRLTTPEFPYVTHKYCNDAGAVTATIKRTEGVAAMITGLNLFFAKCIVDSYTRDMVNAAATIPTHQILSLFLGFRNLYFRTAYNHILKYLRSTYTSTLSQAHSHDILSVLDDRREETITFDTADTSPRAPGQRGTHPHQTSVPTKVSYDTPIRDNWQHDRPTDTIPTVITCPQVPEEILVTLIPTMVNDLYKN
jgi:hypothetical protein